MTAFVTSVCPCSGVDIHIVGGFQTRRTTREEDAAAAAMEEKEGSGVAAAEEEGEDDGDHGEHEMDQSDGLVQVRDLLLLLHSYAAGAHGRPCEMRLQTLCVGPLNTAWGPEDMPAAAVTAAAASDPLLSATPAVAAAPLPLSFPRPLLTSLFVHVDSGLAVGRMPYARADRGPEMVVRTLRGGVGPPEELSHVYEESSDRFVVRAFKHDTMHVSRTHLRALARAACFCVGAVRCGWLSRAVGVSPRPHMRTSSRHSLLRLRRHCFPLAVAATATGLSGAESPRAALPARRGVPAAEQHLAAGRAALLRAGHARLL